MAASMAATMAKPVAQLTPGMTKQEIAAFVEQVLSGLTLDEKISLMAGRRSNMLRLAWTTLAFRQFNRYPVPAGGIRRHAIPPVRFSERHLFPRGHGPGGDLGSRAGGTGR